MSEIKEKNVGGRPLKFKTKDLLEKGIKEYFDKCDNRVVEKMAASGKVMDVKDPAPYTLSGLALALGINRFTLMRYGKRDEFCDTVSIARDKVESDVENRLMEKNATGAIFNLKNNFGWKDKTEQEQTIDNNISGNLTINNLAEALSLKDAKPTKD